MNHKNQWSMQVAARLVGMQAEAASIFHSLGHNGNRGTAREIFVKDFLIPFLPPNVGVGTGEIINHVGGRSNQIDIILFNRGRLPPVLLGTADLGIFPWECVIATIEVKSRLNAEEVRSSILNSYSVRRVVQSLADSSLLLNGKQPLELRPWFLPIPSYIFAFETDLRTHAETEPYTLGPEANRLAEQRNTVSRNFYALLQAEDDAQKAGDIEQLETLGQKLTHYRQLSDQDQRLQQTEVGDQDLQGICVLGQEWSHGHILFDDQIDTRFSERPVRSITKMNFHPSSVIGDGSMKETLHFLGHLLLLAREMPRCFEHYSLDRYLTW